MLDSFFYWKCHVGYPPFLHEAISFPPARGARRCGSRSSRRTAASGWAPTIVWTNSGNHPRCICTILQQSRCYMMLLPEMNMSKSRLFFNYKTWDVLWVLRSKVKLSLRMPPGNLRWGVEFFLLLMGKYVGDDFPTWGFSAARLYYHRMRCLGDTQVTIPMRWDPCSQLLYDIIHQWFPGAFVVHLPPNSIDRNEHLPTHEQAYSIIITFWRGWPLLKTTETDECSLFKIWKHLRIPDTSDISCKPRIFRTRFEHA